MQKLVVLLLFFIPLLSQCQRLHLDLFGGFSNYLGDLQQKSAALEQSSRAFGVGATYDLTRHLSVRSGFTIGKIGADDKNNESLALRQRNLSFQTVVKEFNLLAQYTFIDLRYHKLSPYVFGGVALYHFNPYTYDSSGSKVYLHSLGTEGQGLAAYPGREAYKLTQFALPFGGGIRLRLRDNVTIAYELGLRKLFTDYLDDVSSTYADASLLAAAKGPKALELAYRGGEVKNNSTVYPAAGTIRGNPGLKDWYYFHGITLSIALPTGRHAGSRMDCPVDVK